MSISSHDSALATFLWKEATVGDAPFSARNFLLDGAFCAGRADSYLDSYRSYLRRAEQPALTDGDDWRGLQDEYLKLKVQLERPPGMRTGRLLNSTDRAVCPETFRFEAALSAFGGAAPDIDLLRFLDLESLFTRAAPKHLAPGSKEQLLKAAQNCAAFWPDVSQAPKEDLWVLQGWLDAWNQAADLRPAFVALYGEHEELFEDGFTASWADELRDRLGLWHFGPQPMLLFRYPAAEVPELASWRMPRPLAIPTVLDGRHNEAFCPAPAGEDCGRLVDLQARGSEPARELLHPYIDLRADFLFRVSAIGQPVPLDLAPARQSHLERLRSHHRHPDFARETDP